MPDTSTENGSQCAASPAGLASPLESTRSWRLRPLLVQGALVAIILIGATAAAWFYLDRYVTTVGFAYKVSTYWFGPSVMLASGRGFVDPVPDAIPGLRDFLDERSGAFDTASIPGADCSREPEGLQKCYRYLLYAVGLTWRIGGVSWAAYKVFLAILFGILAAVVYGLFRLGMGRLLSLAGTAVFMLSPVVLTIAPSSRDFAKAPFILAVVLLVARLALRPVARRWAYWVASGALGVLIGVGLGFREDVLICIVPALLAILLPARGPAGLRLRHRLGGMTLFIACFLLTAWPILRQMNQEGPRTAHQIICGMATEREAMMGIEPASYERVYCFSDGYTHAIENSYGHRVLGITDRIPYQTRLSSHSGTRYVLEVVRRFPADMMTRVFASTSRILGGSFVRLPGAEYPSNDFVRRSEALERPFAAHLERYKAFYALAALLILSGAGFRTGWVVLLLVCYFTGYACLQFHVRHCFHLMFLSLWLFGFVIERAVAAVWQLRTEAGRDRFDAMFSAPRHWWGPSTKRVVAFAASAAVLPALVYWGACAYQCRQVGHYVEQCRASEVEPVEVQPVSSEDAVTFTLVSPILAEHYVRDARVWEVDTDYVVAAFVASPQCREIRIEYDSETPFNDFSHIVVLDAGGMDPARTTYYFFPVYQTLFTTIVGTENPFQGFDGRWGRSVFKGITVPREQASEFLGLYRVVDLTRFTLLMNVSISDGNAGFRCRQHVRFATAEPQP